MECSQCGVCCKLFLINLNKEEYNSKKFRTEFEEFGHEENFQEAERSCSNVLKQKEDGSCFYLKDKKCSIHDNRPEVCRNFFCDSKEEKFKEMIEEIKLRKTTAEH